MTSEREHSRSETFTIGIAITAAIVLQSAWMGPAVIGLDVGLGVAFALWASRAPIDTGNRPRALRLFLLGIAVQVLHFSEELLTGFPRALPGFFGYAWSDARFAAFNVVWLAIFALAAYGLQRGIAAAEVVVWFFAIAGGVANGVLHISASAIQRSYFSGLITAPFLFAVGVALLQRLLPATAVRPRSAKLAS